jgi:Fur family ferric uptake transcriptional regulator
MKSNCGCEIKESGIKNTKHRRQVLELLKMQNQPISAEEVYKGLSAKKISINLSTVYRILETFVGIGIVTSLDIGSGNKMLYEFNCNVHRHYLVCRGCSRIITVKSCPLADYEKDVEKDTGFCITGHKLSLYGYCAQCAAAKKNE